MRFPGLFSVSLLALLASLLMPATAQHPIDARDVIREQLEAFAADDPEAAFAIASDGIRERFGSAARFVEMVQQRYPALYQPRHIAFADTLDVSDERVHQFLLVVDQNGRSWTAVYSVVHVDGEWRIEGVSLQETPQSAV